MSALTTKDISREASAHLDLIRALAAIMVATSHIRGLFFVDYKNIKHLTLFDKALYFFTGLGHQAVIIFFVLSGLLVGGSVLKSMRAQKWSWSAYITARLSRLYVVLIPGLTLTWLLDTVGLALTHGGFTYSGNSIFGNIIVSPIANSHTLKDFFGSLFFVQTILTQPFGSNMPLWSLANEFWYYVIFPLCLFSFVIRRNTLKTRVIFGVVAIALFLFVGWSIAILFIAWLLGVVVYACHIQKPYFKRSTQLFCVLQLAVMLYLIRAGLIKNATLSDLALSVSISILLWTILSFSKNNFGKLYGKITHQLASFSYTLYVVHLPFVIFIHAMICRYTHYFSNGRWNPDVAHLAVGAFVFIVVMLYAYGISLLTEKHTGVVRRNALAIARASIGFVENRLLQKKRSL